MLKKKFMDALAESKNGMTSRELANAIGRKDGALTSYDRKTLRNMEKAGDITIYEQTRGVAGKQYLYSLN